MGVVGALQEMQTDGPRTFIFQSAIGTNLPDSKAHGQKALGSAIMCAIGCIPGLKASFRDMSMAEEFIIEARSANPTLNLVPLRCAVLEDQKDLVVDLEKGAAGYVLIKGGQTGKFSGRLNRQYAAQAALDLCNAGPGDENTN